MVMPFTCQVEPNHDCPTAGAPCVSTIACGDGIRTVNESCDDGNVAPGDGCDASCLVESGWYCPTANAPCLQITTCGDGRIDYIFHTKQIKTDTCGVVVSKASDHYLVVSRFSWTPRGKRGDVPMKPAR